MKHFFVYSFFVLVIVVVFFGANHLLNAQTADTNDLLQNGYIQQQVNADVSPQNPTANQPVTISLSAYGSDINSAVISWSVNGVETKKGTGLSQFTFTTGKNGEVNNVVATIQFTNSTVTKSFTITPQDVSIIYESDGYTPPFYKGKGLYGIQGTVTLVAIPNLFSSNGTRLNPKNLTYKWTVDGTVLGSKSGYGKNSLSYTGSILGKDVGIQVDVSSSGGSTGVGYMVLSAEKPETLIYQKNPLYGILFNKELTSNGFSLSEKEVTLDAIPYSTSASGVNDSNLSYTWTVDGNSISTPKNQNYVTLRNTTGKSGNSQVSVVVDNNDHFLQEMTNYLRIAF